MKRCGQHILCCEEVTYDTVTGILYALKQEVAALGSQVIKNMWYGTRMAEDVWSRMKKLKVFHSLLYDIRVALVKRGSLCLSCVKVNAIVEAARSEVGFCDDKNTGLEVDSSGRAEWSIQNPTCIPYEKWEAAMYEVCDLIGIDIVRVDKQSACDLSYAVISKKIPCEIFVEITKKSKDCKIKYDIFTDAKTCDIKYQGVLSKKECKVAYQSLLKSGCKVGFHDYVNVLNCGVDPKLIQKVYGCGMSLRYDRTKACPVLVSSEGVDYYFSDFNVVNESDIWSRLNSLNIA